MQIMQDDPSDDVPIVIAARWRLADRLARAYGLECFLAVDEGPEMDPSTTAEIRKFYERSNADVPLFLGKYSILIRSKQEDLAFSWTLSNPRKFHEGMRSCYEFLENGFDLKLTLYDITSPPREAAVSRGELPPVEQG